MRRRRFETLASTLGNQVMQGLAQRGQLRIEAPSGTITFDPAALGEGVSPPLEDRQAVERQTGVDLGDVRIHDSREARRIVRAVDSDLVTFGIDILRGGPVTSAQLRHELAHIAQHGARPVDPSRPIVLGPRRAPEEHDAWSIAMGGERQAVGDPNVARRDEEFDPSLERYQPEHDRPVFASDFDRPFLQSLSSDFDEDSGSRIGPSSFADPASHEALAEYIRALGEGANVPEEVAPDPALEEAVTEEPPGGTECVACHPPSHAMPSPPSYPALSALGDSGYGTRQLTGFGGTQFPPFPTYEPAPRPDPCPNCHEIINRPVYRRVPPEPSTHEIWVRSMEAGAEQALKNEGQTVEETAELIDMQIIAARGRALGAAQAAGAAPPDLLRAWRSALMEVEALKLAAPALAQAPGAITFVQHGAEPGPEIELEIQDAARDAIGGFYWGMIDALERLEAEQAQRQRVDERRQQLDLAQSPPGFRCRVNCHEPNGPVREYYRAPARRSPDVIERAARLDTVADVASWRTVLEDFERTYSADLEFLISETLPPDSEEVSQLALARQLRERFDTLRREHPTIVRVPAVFYPKHDLAFEQQADGSQTQQAQGYSWYLFVYRDGNRIVLKDITSNEVFTNTQGVPESRACSVMATPEAQAEADFPTPVMQNLFKQLDTKLRFPSGRLYYTWPGGRQGHLDTHAKWEMSDWLSAIGITLAAIGLVLVTAGYGTPAAIALVGSGLVGAAATYTSLQERERHGIATESDRNRAYFEIGLDILSALTFGVGRIASATRTFGRLASFAGRAYAPLVRLNAAGNLAQLAVMTDDFVTAIEQIGAMPDSADKDRALMRLVFVGLASGALAVTSLRGDIADLTRGARPRLHADVDGRLAIHPDVDMPPATTRTTVADVPQPGTSTWRRPTVRTAEPDPALGDRSVVIDIRRRSDGLVTDVQVVPGRLADPDDIELHRQVAEIVAGYGGFQGRIRLAWREIQAMFGRRRPPIELELEIWKLEELVRRRVAVLRSATSTRGAQRQARRDLAVIERNLARTRQRAQRALARPTAPGQSAQIWMSTAPPGHPQPPSGYGWYLTSNGRWQLTWTDPGAIGPVRLRAVHDDAGNFLEISNREQVMRSRVIGRRVEEVADRLRAMGYRVDGNRIIRPRGQGMLGLRADRHTGIIRESVRETTEVAQDRLEGTLNRAQRRELQRLRDVATPDQEVVILEGIFDLGTTWTQVINHHGGRLRFINRLAAAGVSRTEATRIVDALIARPDTLKVVQGTAPLRSYDYTGAFTRGGGVVPSGGHVHHGDPLYLGGTHELLSGLAPGPHARVHAIFNSLTLPPGSRLPAGTSLAPGSLSAAIPRSSWRRGAATIHHGGATPGRIDYETLSPSTHRSATPR